MTRDIALRAFVRCEVLHIHGKVDVRDAAITQGRAARQVGHRRDVCRAHDPRVVNRDVHKKLVEIDVLLGMGIDQVVEMMTRDREHGLAVELGVIKTVQ